MVYDWLHLPQISGLIIGILLGIVLTLWVSVVIVLIFRQREKKLYQTLDQMLEAAIEGDFKESHFDESRLSALESRFRQYFSGQAMTQQKMNQERDKITALISDISHQTKTPLSSIVLYSNLLGESLEKEGASPLDETSQTCFKHLRLQSEKLQFLIDALIKASRLETGIIALHKESIDVTQLADQVIDQVKPLADAKAISLSPPTDEVGGLTLTCDLKWTLEALYNIVSNAIKYSPEGSQIKISIIQYPLFVCLQISDQGIGIPESEVPLIFNRFYRGQKALSSEGVGIGLYITRSIIKAQGGYIKVDANPLGGSVFSVYLPLE